MLAHQLQRQQAFKFCKAARHNGSFKHGVAAMSAGKHGKWQLAWALFQDMSRAAIRPGTPVANAVVAACGRAFQWEKAISLLHVDQDESRTLDVIGYGAAMAACMRATAWRQTVRLLFSMEAEHILPNALCYSASIAACGREYQWALALHLLLMSRCFVAQPNVPRRIHSSQSKKRDQGLLACAQAAVHACEVSHQWELAVQLLNWSVRLRLSPNSKLYEHVISACDRGRTWTNALAAFVEADTSQQMSLELQRCTLKACSRSSVWTAALSVLEFSQRHDIHLETTAISGCERASQWVRALALFFDTHNRSGFPSAASLRCVLRSLGTANHWEEALRIWCDAHESLRADPWALSATVWACEVTGENNVASALLSACRHALPVSKEFKLVAFVQCHAQRGNLASVVETIENYALSHKWLKIVGGEKRKVFDSCMRPGDTIVELGAYVGYSSLRLAQQQRILTAKRSTSEELARITAVEAHPWTAMAARAIIDFAGASQDVLVRIGRAVDWLRSPLVLGPIDVLILDHRGTSYHEDLMIAEPCLEYGARVITDNVLHPGAPQLLAYAVGRYEVIIHSVHEFGHKDLDDWVLEMKAVQRTHPGFKPSDPYADPELRRWSAEVDRLCRKSQEGPVDWVAFQKRMRPALEKFVRRSRHCQPNRPCSWNS